MHFHIHVWLIWPRRSTRTPAPTVMKFTILGHHYYMYIFSLSDLCPGVEKKILKEIHQFYILNTQIISLCEIYNFFSPCPTDGIMLQTKFNKDGSSSSWEEDVKARHAGRHTTTDASPYQYDTWVTQWPQIWKGTPRMKTRNI